MTQPLTEASAAGLPQDSPRPLLSRLWRDESGQDTIEYALIVTSMGLFTVAGLHGLASSISGDFNIVLHAFNSAIGIIP